ncbi:MULTISPECIES: cytochrome b/b6 domain-containing protein [unclassified Ruegeria]|uniref:cytochrome b/b6 domain-containing protein n=1 Tax=unclassified Ruegeria TaxID=2625375 RepID=UPI001AE23EAC|nr:MULTISPECIES: cytochrome b/b6 domain-containing protein [unclassified Ruegeria]
MSETQFSHRGRTGAHEVQVWDPLVRLVHWVVALCVLINAAISNPEGAFHEYVGYVVLALVLLRLLWGLTGPAFARFTAFPLSSRSALNHLRDMGRGDRSVHLSHNPLGALMVYNLWATLLALCVTGIMMGTVRFFGVEWVEGLHELAFNWLMLSVLLHVAGVFIDQWRTGVALAKAMITGRKNIPEDWSIK